MDLKLPVVLFDELSETVIRSSGLLDMASGEITRVDYEDYDIGTQGLPAEQEDYEFTSGMLSNGDRDVEFRVEVNVVAGTYSVTPSELLELKGRAARLFASVPPKGVSAVGRKPY